MNWAHIHLAVNHVPVILVPAALALLAWGVIRHSSELMRVGLASLVIAAAMGAAVYFTGEPAEGVIEDIEGISKPAIEEHEEAAGFAAVATVLAGVLAVGALFSARGGRAVPPMVLAATFVVTLAAAAALLRTAYLGGFIHHAEITLR
jgi:uncharacterized membrane protein